VPLGDLRGALARLGLPAEGARAALEARLLRLMLHELHAAPGDACALCGAAPGTEAGTEKKEKEVNDASCQTPVGVRQEGAPAPRPGAWPASACEWPTRSALLDGVVDPAALAKPALPPAQTAHTAAGPGPAARSRAGRAVLGAMAAAGADAPFEPFAAAARTQSCPEAARAAAARPGRLPPLDERAPRRCSVVTCGDALPSAAAGATVRVRPGCSAAVAPAPAAAASAAAGRARGGSWCVPARSPAGGSGPPRETAGSERRLSLADAAAPYLRAGVKGAGSFCVAGAAARRASCADAAAPGQARGGAAARARRASCVGLRPEPGPAGPASGSASASRVVGLGRSAGSAGSFSRCSSV
jgi:hypothetical protein